MSANSVYRFNNTSILSVVALEAPEVVTSASFDDQLEPTLERLGLRRGMLEQVAGINERRWWPEGVTYSESAAEAGKAALDAAGISPDQIGLLIDTSVCRARLEPRPRHAGRGPARTAAARTTACRPARAGPGCRTGTARTARTPGPAARAASG